MDVRFVLRFHDNTPSGGRKILYEYANFLVNKGHHVTIVFVADTPFQERKWNFLASIKHYGKYLRDKRYQQQIDWFGLDSRIDVRVNFSAKQIKKESKEVLVAFDYGIALSLAEQLNDFSNCFYLIQHDEKVYYDESVVRKAWMLPFTKIVISTWLYNKVKKYDSKVLLVKNYVDTKKFFVFESLENRQCVVSLIQHPNPSKGTQIGIAALEIVKQRFPELKVIMFGTHDPIKDLPKYFTYYKKADEKTLRNDVYNKSAIYLLPSFLEGWGLTATEAMSCGATLVSTQNGGVEDFGFQNETALLSRPGDVQAMAANIIDLLQNKEKRIRLGYSGVKEVQGLTFSKSAHLFENALLGKIACVTE